jgi:cyclopropane fatty-acyl-phospholipid synthase-like methyltransferase
MNTTFIKENLKKYYNQEAELRDSKSVKPDWKIKVRDHFLNVARMESKRTLLEIGAGAGYDSQFFMNNGFTVMAVDLSSEMIKKCREKLVEAYELDFYKLSSLNKRFDCVYAMNTLLHVPKVDLRHVLNEIDFILNENGLFYMGLYGGEDTENEFINSDVSDTPRFFSFYSASQLKTTLEDFFHIIHFESFDIGTGKDIFHSIIMRKSKST